MAGRGGLRPQRIRGSRIDTAMKAPHYANTLILVTVVLPFALLKGSGMAFPLLVLGFIAWLPYNAVRMLRRADERKPRALRLGIWCLALVLVGVVQAHWSAATRSQADIAAQAVLAYQARTGSYPPSLQEVGVDEPGLREDWGIRYLLRERQGVLSHPATFMPLTSYDYDFGVRKWVQNAY